ncbi:MULTISPECIES: acyl-CoA dehydrogenase family protein [Pseudofrankia]|uniref:acyl-CoA dehydrogenase family protein n=1 Tax=Pseudofrankia TaxID=2994363 RepID=UPI000234C77B|nr:MULTISPECIES: acyl-CoA dehydrogenase family protein [Pseudofrankia]OHV39204.1 acyl-CoA dehydrogenase [Pseudofrankia sp. EUN1h]
MHFDLDEDGLALQATVRDLCGERLPLDATRNWTDAASFDRAAWRALAELGAFTMTQPEERGGLELGVADAGLVFQVLGAELVPGPLVAAALVADLDERVGAGEAFATVVTRPPAGSGPARAGGPWVIPHLDLASDVYVVDDEGVWRTPADTVEGRPVPNPLDPATPMWLADAVPAGEQVGGPELARGWLLRGSILASALLAGNATRTVELATAYAKQREQFGRVIGGFQAVKHLLAEAFTRAEVARVAVDAAAVALDDAGMGAGSDEGFEDGYADPTFNPVRAIAGARVLAADAASRNAKTAIQVHGGMGFTWETTIHLFLKRAWVLRNAFTTPEEAADTVAHSLTRPKWMAA